jgi:septum formation protein
MAEHTRSRPLVLASRSPRRRDLLERRGYAFEVLDPAVDERALPGEAAPALARRLALEKARAVAALAPRDSVVLGCDTLVVLGDEVLGKPAHVGEAVEMLLRIAGRTHTVFTAFAAVAPALAREEVGVESSRVTLRAVGRAEAEAYAASGEPLDKAGAYALQGQGARFVARVEGSRSNVIGLPLERVEPLLESFGVTPA